MELNVCIYLLDKNKISECDMLICWFYIINCDNNGLIYVIGKIRNVFFDMQRMSVEDFDRLFEMDKIDGFLEEIKMYMMGIIDGVKYGKEMQMMDMNNKKIIEKFYLLVFKFGIFVIIE